MADNKIDANSNAIGKRFLYGLYKFDDLVKRSIELEDENTKLKQQLVQCKTDANNEFEKERARRDLLKLKEKQYDGTDYEDALAIIVPKEWYGIIMSPKDFSYMFMGDDPANNIIGCIIEDTFYRSDMYHYDEYCEDKHIERRYHIAISYDIKQEIKYIHILCDKYHISNESYKYVDTCIKEYGIPGLEIKTIKHITEYQEKEQNDSESDL